MPLTITSQDIATRIAGERKMPLADVSAIVHRFLGCATEAISTGISVRCRDFGTFYPKPRATGFNVKFRVAKNLKEEVHKLNQG